MMILKILFATATEEVLNMTAEPLRMTRFPEIDFFMV